MVITTTIRITTRNITPGSSALSGGFTRVRDEEEPFEISGEA